jgi:hypothetical protein
MLADLGKLDSALIVLRRAHQQAPSVGYILEGIGLVYVRMNEIDSASTIADKLLDDDSTSAAGHLIALVCAVERHDRASAVTHYKAFVEYGYGRSDYDNVRARFAFLDQ